MAETQLVLEPERAAIMDRARVRWHEPFVMAIRMVGRDWFAFGVGVGVPLTLQIPAVAEAARFPWTLACLGPLAAIASVAAVRRHMDPSRESGETRTTRRVGEAVVIAAVVTSTMMLNSLANEGSVAGMLIKGAGVVAAAGLGYLSHLGLSAIERGRRTESCEGELTRLIQAREAESKAKTDKRKVAHRSRVVGDAEVRLVEALVSTGVPVSPAVYGQLTSEIESVAGHLDPTDPTRMMAQLEMVVRTSVAENVKAYARVLMDAAGRHMVETRPDGAVVVSGEVARNVFSNDPRVNRILAGRAVQKQNAREQKLREEAEKKRAEDAAKETKKRIKAIKAARKKELEDRRAQLGQ